MHRNTLAAAVITLGAAVAGGLLVADKRPNDPERKRITRVTTNQKEAKIEGRLDQTVEIVLQIAKSKRSKKLEWTTRFAGGGTFTASITRSEKIKLDNDKTGRGIVFRVVTASGLQSQANIAITERDPVPNGTVQFRPKKRTNGQVAIKRKGDSVEFADIKLEDGTLVPIALLVRKRSQ